MKDISQDSITRTCWLDWNSDIAALAASLSTLTAFMSALAATIQALAVAIAESLSATKAAIVSRSECKFYCISICLLLIEFYIWTGFIFSTDIDHSKQYTRFRQHTALHNDFLAQTQIRFIHWASTHDETTWWKLQKRLQFPVVLKINTPHILYYILVGGKDKCTHPVNVIEHSNDPEFSSLHSHNFTA